MWAVLLGLLLIIVAATSALPHWHSSPYGRQLPLQTSRSGLIQGLSPTYIRVLGGS